MAILTINAGSSSLKLSLFREDIWAAGAAGTITATGSATPRPEPIWKDDVDLEKGGINDDDFWQKTLTPLWQGEKAPLKNKDQIKAVGHRVVHGGSDYYTATAVTDEMLEHLRDYIELDPTHEKANIEAIEQARKLLPGAKHIAVFDTSYHHDMPLVSQVYAGPYSWYADKKIRRYGFHGINHKYCAERVERLMGRRDDPQTALEKLRVITCHLGSGGSLCASFGARSQMTTMGYTPLEGLIMRTRSGTIDPGLIFVLLAQGVRAENLYHTLNHDSGLAGISGIKSGDLREIEKVMADNGDDKKSTDRARLAFDMYVQGLTSAIAGLVPVLQGLDVLVFSGGIGQHSPSVRKAVCEKLTFLGVALDHVRNENPEPEQEISAPRAAVRTFIIAAGEEAAIAADASAFIQ